MRGEYPPFLVSRNSIKRGEPVLGLEGGLAHHHRAVLPLVVGLGAPGVVVLIVRLSLGPSKGWIIENGYQDI